MHQGGARGPRRRRQAAHRQRVDLQRRDRILLGAVDIVVGHAIDDDMRLRFGDLLRHGTAVGHVQGVAVQRDDLPPRRGELAHDRGAEQPPRARDQQSHQSRSARTTSPTTADCCASVSSA